MFRIAEVIIFEEGLCTQLWRASNANCLQWNLAESSLANEMRLLGLRATKESASLLSFGIWLGYYLVDTSSELGPITEVVDRGLILLQTKLETSRLLWIEPGRHLLSGVWLVDCMTRSSRAELPMLGGRPLTS